MMEIYTNVMRSTNYDMFKFMGGNRKVNSTNLNQIIASMKEKQLIIPITVNEKLEIIDGQHRFSACKHLKLPVYFVIEQGYNLDDVIRANVNGGRKWYDEDYLNRYCIMNNKKYLQIKEIVNNFDITVNDFIKLLAFIQNKKINFAKREFREGKVSLDGMNLLESFLIALEDFKEISFYKRSNFISAFCRLYFREDYDHEHMVKKLYNNGYNLKYGASSDDYLSQLCNKVYSFGVCKSPIYYSSESKKFHQ